MKICPKCSNLAFDDQSECRTCGSRLASVAPGGGPSPGDADTPSPADSEGESPPDAGGDISAISLQSTIEALETQQAAVTRRNRFLAVALGASAALLLLVLVVWHRAAVGSYARLSNVSIEQDATVQGKVRMSFRVSRPGKVRYVRESGRTKTEVMDSFDQPGRQTHEWNWAYDPGKDIKVTVRHRSSLTRKFTRAKFPTTPRIDVVVIMDTTESMDPFIDGLKKKCADFAEAMEEGGLKCRFALVAFGDKKHGQWISKHEFVEDVAAFKRQVQAVGRHKGGDLPESSLDALEYALGLGFKEGVPVAFVLVTDADYNEPTSSGVSAGDVAAKMATRGIMTYVVSKRILRGRYSQFMRAGGRFYAIEAAAFPSILTDVGRQIVAGSG